MDLVGTHHSSFQMLVKYFWKTKPIIQIHNCAFTFRYSETVDIVKDREMLTTVMIELTCTEIKNLPIVSLAQKCFNELNDRIPLHFVLATSNRKDRIQLYVVPLIQTEAHETNLFKKAECSNPRRFEENRQRVEQYFLKKQQSQAGSGRVAIPTASSSISDSENRGKEHILTQTEAHGAKKGKSSKKWERDRLRAEQYILKKRAETKERICQMWTVPAEAKCVICSSKSDSESSDKES